MQKVLSVNKILASVLLFFFITGSFIPVLNSILASSALVGDSWNTKTSMNEPRYRLEVVVVDGKIYAIGGYTSANSVDSVSCGFVGTNECYDPVTDTWTNLKSMPTPRGDFIIVSCQGKIYFMGGVDGTIFILGPPVLHQLDIVEVYDPITDTWESKQEALPIYVKEGMQAQVINEQIFIITPDGELYMYHSVTDNWSTRKSLNSQEKFLQTLVVNKQLFVITQTTIHMYNPDKDTWTNKTNMPTSRTYAFSDVLDNKIVVGDFLLSTETNAWGGLFNAQLRVSIYDPISNVWHDGKITDEHIFATNPVFNAVTIGVTSGVYAPKNVYIFGIEADKEDILNIKPFTWIYNPVDDVWSTTKVLDTAPYIRGCKIVMIDDVFYMVGGIFNVEYVPIGYNSQGYPVDRRSSVLTWPIMLVTAVLIASAVTVSLTFYIRKKRDKRAKYE